MATIRVIYENGSPERTIEFDPAEAPFQHDGHWVEGFIVNPMPIQ